MIEMEVEHWPKSITFNLQLKEHGNHVHINMEVFTKIGLLH